MQIDGDIVARIESLDGEVKERLTGLETDFQGRLDIEIVDMQNRMTSMEVRPLPAWPSPRLGPLPGLILRAACHALGLVHGGNVVWARAKWACRSKREWPCCAGDREDRARC